MNVSFSIKERNQDTGQWAQIDVASLAGKTLRQVLENYIGQEAVAEFVFGEETFYFTGTAHWQERMSRKGRAVQFDAAVKIIQEKKPELLEEVLPMVETIAGVFEGATLHRINFGEQEATP